MLLHGEGLSKYYGDKGILDQVSLTLEENSSLALTGPSGSGKTTLLSILGLLLEPTSGTVFFHDKNITALSDHEKSSLRNESFGFIFQGTQLIGSLTVLDNVLVPGYLARRRGLETKAKKLLQELGMSHRLAYYPHQLSIGQKRRVSIARALLLDPVIVFADEPTNDLDPELSSWVGDYLLDLPSRGCSLVLVTHDHQLARRADKQLVVSDASVKENTCVKENTSVKEINRKANSQQCRKVLGHV